MATGACYGWGVRCAVLLMLLVLAGCHGHSHSHGVFVGPVVRMGSNENVDAKRHEWFQGLYRDCVHRHFANACFKTGQNIEDGVVAAPNVDDAHWFYAKACDLQGAYEACDAADRTAPMQHDDDAHHHDDAGERDADR